jgi:hypothetical protein
MLKYLLINCCEYGPKNDPNFDRPKMTQILALALALALACVTPTHLDLWAIFTKILFPKFIRLKF